MQRKKKISAPKKQAHGSAKEQRKLAAIMFTDMVGYGALMKKTGRQQ